MGLTKDYLRFVYGGRCNLVGQNGAVQSVDKVSCAVSACESVVVFNMRTLEKTAEINREGVEVTAFRFSDDRKLLAIGYADGEVHLHRRNRNSYNEEHAVFSGHRTGVNCLAFSNDGLTLASGGKDSVIVLWDVVSESGLFRLGGHKSTITQLQFTLDDKHLISRQDHQLKFWEMGSQSCFYTLSESMSEVYGFSLLKGDRLLVVGTANAELDVYELSWTSDFDRLELNDEEDEQPALKKKPLVGTEQFEEENAQGNEIMSCKRRGVLTRHAKGRALQLTASSDESLLCCVGSDSTVDVFRVYSDEEAQKRLRKKVHKFRKTAEAVDGEELTFESDIARDVSLLIARIGGVELSSKVKWIDLFAQVRESGTRKQYRMYSLLKTNTVQGVLIDVDTKANTLTSTPVVDLDHRGHRTDVRSLSVTANDAAVLSCASESAILWDLRTLMPLNRFADEKVKDMISSVFVPGDKQFVVGTKSGALHVFDVPTCELIHSTTDAHAGAIWQILALPDGGGFVTCSSDKKAKFWRFQTVSSSKGRRLTFREDRQIELPDEALCMAISPNGKLIAFGLLDNTARVYYLNSLKFFLSLYGHSLPVTCVDIGPDSKLIATGSVDKTVKIWGLDFGDCHRSLFAHDDVVSCVKFNTDLEEQLLWSAGKDAKIKQWNAKKFDQIQVLNGHFAEIRALQSTSFGNTLISASHDKSIRLWEQSEEIIKIVDAEDIVPGENPEDEIGMAAKKNVSSVKGAESILEALEIYRTESALLAEDPKHKLHPMVAAFNSSSLHHFVLDVIHRVNSAHLERSLLLVPFDYVIDVLNCVSTCVEQNYKLELGSRVAIFLLKTNLNQLIGQRELLPLIKNLQRILPSKAKTSLDRVNFNLAALRTHKLEVEERDQVKLFRLQKSGKKKPKTKKSRSVAIVKPLNV
ncbi:Utp12 domain-containing protein [Aphelenchoides fujianensis]|nr:Utp12 domain-containing protein [Aphelenchoides fujianensis]